jgi:hypothetical protein
MTYRSRFSGLSLIAVILGAILGFGGQDRRSIRTIHFGDYVYEIPQLKPDEAPEFKVLKGKRDAIRIKLTAGRGKPSSPFDAGWASVSLHSIAYGDLDRDGQEEAMVHVLVQSGGTLTWGFLFIYGLVQDDVRLLDTFLTGHRGNGGFHKAYVERGRLVVEIYAPDEGGGDCCPRFAKRVRFLWQGRGFEVTGQEETIPVGDL